MRLWHKKLISKLPRQQILGLHREICALRGNSWGKKHATVNYVFKHSPEHLVAFHHLVMNEMKNRGYKVDKVWYEPAYRGKKCEPWDYTDDDIMRLIYIKIIDDYSPIYPEHNDDYLIECIENLKAKGVIIND